MKIIKDAPAEKSQSVEPIGNVGDNFKKAKGKQ